MTLYDVVGGAVWFQSMVLLAALMFAAFESVLVATGQRRCFKMRRSLGLAACASVLVLPVALHVLLRTPYAVSINATDAIVAHYLKGHIAMSAHSMQMLVELQETVRNQVISGTSVLINVCIIVFLAAAIARAGYLVATAWRIRSVIRNGWVMACRRRVQVVVTPDIAIPFSTRGLWTYYVVLPQNMLRDGAALRMSLGHELQHIRQGDVDTEVLMSLISPVLILNPGFWYLSGQLRKLGELACDRAVLSRDRMDARSYALRLLSVARHGGRAATPYQPGAFGVPLLGRALAGCLGRTALKSRILEIAHDLERPARERRWMGGVLALALMLSIVCVATSLSRPTDWSHERIMLSTVVNLERIDQLNTLAQRSW